MDVVTTQAILDAGLADWRMLAQGLHGHFLTRTYADGLRFLEAVGEGCAEVRLTAGFVELKLLSEDAVHRDEHTISRVTERELEQARRISSIAESLGFGADPMAVRQLELALDTADLAAVGPFWAAVLAGTSYGGGDVVDPTGRVPNLWFQTTESHETPRQRFHLDLWVPHDVADERIAAGVAAGGRITYDQEAPAFTVLADPEGNKVCICTCLDR
ncbi:VOC family protein [Kribbella sp. CA-247076]|uniref:VOC family protein n=1 Tax=Kribbella sp. CA-247076 TaxID=3239941 RepID=UPI003D8A3E1B